MLTRCSMLTVTSCLTSIPAAGVSLDTGVLPVHGAVLVWPRLSTVRDQEEAPGGCCKLCPSITELQVYLIGFSYKRNPALTENFKGSSLELSASMKRTNRTVNFNESQNTDCTID